MLNSARSSSSTHRPSVRESDVARAGKGELLSWEQSLRMLQRADFKFRLMNLNGRVLLDNAELIENVRSCLDLSSITPEHKVEILPGRSHAGDRDADVVKRRELVQALYDAMSEAGVQDVLPLKFEEARYVNEVVGAMLIWIFRVFAQHEVLIKAWKRCSKACDDADQRVIEAKKIVVQREIAWEELVEELRLLRLRNKEVSNVPTPTELTTPDRIVIKGPTPNVFFTNGRISGMAPHPKQLPGRLQLPTSILFYVRLKSQRVSFPFPASIPAKQYLHEAKIVEGMEEAGPVARVAFDSKHVIGLEGHNLLSFCQLVLEVPSTPTVNPTIQATRLSFHPRHESQLHNYSEQLPRIIVPIFVVSGSRGPTDMPSHPTPPSKEELNDVEGVKKAQALSTAYGIPHVPPAGVPPLELTKPLRSPLIGTPLNASDFNVHDAINRSNDPSLLAGSARDSSRSISGMSRSGSRGAWSTSRTIPSDPPQASARSLSPSTRTAAARVAAVRAEALLQGFVKRVVEGYVLTSEEMARMKRLVSIVENRPQVWRTHAYSRRRNGPLPSEQTGTQQPAPPSATLPSDPRRQAMLPTNIGRGSIAAGSHVSNLGVLNSARGARG